MRHPLFRMSLHLCLLLAAAAQAAEPPIPAAAYFPDDYAQSRSRFLARCHAAQARYGGDCGPSFRIEPPDTATQAQPGGHDLVPLGGSDGDLSIDQAYFPSTKAGVKRLLVVVSGNHGPEAQSGAAVQGVLLERHLGALLQRGIDVYLIHALNPWGYRHYRRPDALNVNLNRSFLLEQDRHYYTDKEGNQDYAAFESLFAPRAPVRGPAPELRGMLRFLGRYAFSGFATHALSAGLNTGQYQDPRGLNYGGRPAQAGVAANNRGGAQQSAFLEQRLRPLLLAHHDSPVLILDFHTGLGDRRVLSVIEGRCSLPPGNKGRPLLCPPEDATVDFEKLIARHRPDGIVLHHADDPGYFLTIGDFIDFTPTLAPDNPRIVAVTMEYGTQPAGTIGQVRSAARMILENQAWFHGCGSADTCAAVEADFRTLFNPPDPAWREQVLHQADLVLECLEAGF